jgi:hypothetical protein
LSKYPVAPLDFEKLKTIALRERGGKVKVEHLARPQQATGSWSAWLDGLPHVLAADSLRQVVTALTAARAAGKAIVWGLGGHVIKCGLAPVFIDLMERGFVTALAMNGAAAIHDYELGRAGHTSEDVEAVLPDGRFGAAEETGREINEAARHAQSNGTGWGEALGALLDKTSPPEFRPASLLLAAWKRAVPVTVHAAIGTDTPHTHPAADGAALGAATHHDFRLLCSVLRGLDGGGVYVNVGSAVVLPEVFLKAISAIRNLGYPLSGFTTVNFDFLQHYRPRVNVVERPHVQRGGQGFALTGHHEIMIPLLAALLAERSQ